MNNRQIQMFIPILAARVSANLSLGICLTRGEGWQEHSKFLSGFKTGGMEEIV